MAAHCWPRPLLEHEVCQDRRYMSHIGICFFPPSSSEFGSSSTCHTFEEFRSSSLGGCDQHWLPLLSRAQGRALAAAGPPGAGPGPPPGDGHRHRKTVTGKSSPENRHLKTFGTVRGSFWPKLVKSSCFKPNGRHEQFWSAFFIRKSSGISPKALTTTPFVTDRGPWKIEWAPGPGPGPPTRWYFLSGGIF